MIMNSSKTVRRTLPLAGVVVALAVGTAAPSPFEELTRTS
jgi:hypothetical protein